MIFSKQLPLQSLIELSRALRHNLGAGIALAKVFRQQAQRGTRPVRAVSGRIAAELEQGHDLEKALGAEIGVFPPLFIDLAVLGERSGGLAEIFGELEEYYRLQQKLIREFRSRMVPIMIQFFAALLVLAGVIFVLGAIAESKGEKPPDPLGLGFTGKVGALAFLTVWAAAIALLVVTYCLLARSLKGKAFMDEILLKVPVLGPCLRAFALGRFTLALHLTFETGMTAMEAMQLSLRATSNGAFVARAPIIVQSLKEGDELALALGKTSLFPLEFLNIVAVAEESGRVPEVMRKQAEYYQEEAGRRLTNLTRAAGYAVYALYVIFMVAAIFRLAGTYLRALAG